MGDSRRLLKHLAPFAGFCGDHIRNFTLADDRIAIAPEARIHKQLVDILEPHGIAIDAVFPLSRAVVAAGYGHLVLVEGKGAVAIIEPQCNLRKALRPAHSGPAEDHILHLGAAQAFGGLLAEHPAHRVGNVALSAAVGADNAGDPLVKGEHRFIREGLKALHFKRF